MVAELFGFTSGDHLVRSILAVEPEADVIQGMTDQRMLERYGDLSSPGAIEQAANEAIHNEARARFIATEARALAKAAGQRNIIVSAAKEFAATLIARKKLREIRPAQYASAEARAGRNAERAKSVVEKATEKRNQLVNHYAAKAAYDALDEIEKGVQYLRRVGESKTVDVVIASRSKRSSPGSICAALAQGCRAPRVAAAVDRGAAQARLRARDRRGSRERGEAHAVPRDAARRVSRARGRREEHRAPRPPQAQAAHAAGQREFAAVVARLPTASSSTRSARCASRSSARSGSRSSRASPSSSRCTASSR
jgi:hypothetical protein